MDVRSVEDLDDLSDDEIRAKLHRTIQTSHIWVPLAQVYLDELQFRKQAALESRMGKMTFAVMLMTGIVTIATAASLYLIIKG